MGITYDATADSGRKSLLGVRPGDFVSVRASGDPAQRDVQGRYPHLLYVPGGVNQECVKPTHHDVPIPPGLPGRPREDPEYRDDGGALYVPIAGQVYVAGGAGIWDVYVVHRRGGACEQPTDYRWHLTSYTTAGARLTAIVPPHGAEYLEITDTASHLSLLHGASSDSFTNAPAGRYYLQQVTRISWEPVRDGQLVIHGRM